MNAKTYILNILGINALKAQVAILQSSNEALLKEVVALRDNRMTDNEIAEEISRAIEDMITEGIFADSIEEALNNQDWDSIVSDALSERHCSSVLDDLIEQAELSTNRGFELSVQDAVTNILRSETQSGNDNKMPITNAIKTALHNLPVS